MHLPFSPFKLAVDLIVDITLGKIAHNLIQVWRVGQACNCIFDLFQIRFPGFDLLLERFQDTIDLCRLFGIFLDAFRKLRFAFFKFILCGGKIL